MDLIIKLCITRNGIHKTVMFWKSDEQHADAGRLSTKYRWAMKLLNFIVSRSDTTITHVSNQKFKHTTTKTSTVANRIGMVASTQFMHLGTHACTHIHIFHAFHSICHCNWHLFVRPSSSSHTWQHFMISEIGFWSYIWSLRKSITFYNCIWNGHASINQ